jgi:hypothetical protein
VGDRVRGHVLFVTSNGTGFGHLTRSVAIGRRLPDELTSTTFTLSAAAPVIRRLGFHVEYLSAYQTPGAGSEWSWHRRLRSRIRALLDELGSPGALAFDGVHPYAAVLDVLRERPDLPAVWVRRAMWRPGAGREFLASEAAFDVVLEPGELAAEDDRGLTARRRGDAFAVPPIVLLDEAELLPRAEAERELGLEPGRVNALVQVGAGSDAVDRTVARCLERLAREPGVQAVALESSISRRLSIPDGVVHLRDRYPMSRYYRAFDLCVSGSGYNAFHELIHLGVPTLFVPMPRELDDQAARARWAERMDAGAAVDGPDAPELEERLEGLLDPDRREEIARRGRALGASNGAGPAAELLAELVERGRADAPARRRAWRYRPIFYAWMLARVPPHRVLRLGFQPPRAVCLALGIPDGELVPAVERTLDELGERPERLLVVTDAGDLAALRRLGVGMEYLPPRSEVEGLLERGRAHLPRDGYESWVRRRLAGILEGRSPRTVVGIGPENRALSDTLSARDRTGRGNAGDRST